MIQNSKKAFLLLLLTSTVTFAQLEPKIDVLGTIFGMPVIKAEYLINDDIGVELSYNFRYGKPFFKDDNSIKQSGGGIKIEPRFYLSSYEGGDGYYVGLYIRKQSIFYEYKGEYYSQDNELIEYTYSNNHKFSSLGFVVGYKYFFDSGITIELGTGIGRMLSNEYTTDRKSDDFFGSDDDFSNFDFFGTFGVGYRFDWGINEEESGVDEF